MSGTYVTGTVYIVFQPGAQFTSMSANIQVGNGGSFTLPTSAPLSFAGSFTFGTLSISSVQVSFSNTSGNTPVNGTVTLPVSVTSGGVPTITVNNFSGTAEVLWPTPTQQMSQTLTPGDAIYLNNFS